MQIIWRDGIEPSSMAIEKMKEFMREQKWEGRRTRELMEENKINLEKVCAKMDQMRQYKV